MFIQTKYSWMTDEDVIKLAEQSSDELILELAKRLDDLDTEDDDVHFGCYDQDDVDNHSAEEVQERECEIKKEAIECRAALDAIGIPPIEKLQILNIIDKFIEEI